MTGTPAGAATARAARTRIKHDRWIRELSAAGWTVIQAGHITIDARPSLDLIEVYGDCGRCGRRIAADLAHRWRERTVLESVDEAVEQAGEAEEYATPDSALRWLLVLAWGDLEQARHRAINGRWSIECEHQVCRIIGLTRLVGPLSWRNISVDLILDGIYERIHEAIGTPTPLSDDDRRRAREVKAGAWRSAS